MFFGQNENPFTGHGTSTRAWNLPLTGRAFRSSPPADGQVVTVDYDMGGFGNYIIIKHKQRLLYPLCPPAVLPHPERTEGAEQQTIGYIGNTGLSTGPASPLRGGTSARSRGSD
jgi:murein DD-endopeptidase MepM/ murein hydrolase activator NlpD